MLGSPKDVLCAEKSNKQKKEKIRVQYQGLYCTFSNVEDVGS